MKSIMEAVIRQAVKRLYDVDVDILLSRPEERFGDYATNVALQLAGRLQQNPRQIAEEITASLSSPDIAKAEVAGAGFINLWLSDEALIKLAEAEIELTLKDQVVVAEYSDMNAFKTAHVGHLYTTLVGNSVANLLEACGAKVIRANFGGDVGLHVGKAMWGIMRAIDNDPTKLSAVPEQERSAWVAARYVEGNAAYEEDERAKAEITECNKKAYQLHETGDKESVFAIAYWTCRQWSYDGFEAFYEQLQLDKQPDGTYFIYYPESQTAPKGKELVEHGLEKGIFKQSDEAIVFDGEKVGLHTRVFLTREGLPTYEAKDLGLAALKWENFAYDQSVIITANDIIEYMKVVQAALKELLPETNGKTRHVTHGLVKLTSGQKMSSRKGNVLLPQDVLEAARLANLEVNKQGDESTILGAVKYAFLKNRIGGDIIYDPAESVALEGNSGPYLQYAHARAKSILRKSSSQSREAIATLEAGERSLVRKLSEYTETINKAAAELMPHHVCTYLYELAQAFNSFYEHNRVIGDEREAIRLQLVQMYAETLKKGLALLGISAPEQM